MTAQTSAPSWRTGVVLAGAAVGAMAAATPASANIVGVGNAVFGNSCTTVGAARASGTTVAGSGSAAGNLAQLPLDLSRNSCGNSGIICSGYGV
ncbi:chaplin family protein [Streptomyces sp. SudanB182_2057]|uniref:chaplin family protein n=1 Tax=Streptomyces sp. SudanB182_2057 TaxID=3035281 RepID=UPI003F54EEA3